MRPSEDFSETRLTGDFVRIAKGDSSFPGMSPAVSFHPLYAPHEDRHFYRQVPTSDPCETAHPDFYFKDSSIRWSLSEVHQALNLN